MQHIDLKVWDESAEQGKKLLYSTKVVGPFRVGRQFGAETVHVGLVKSPSTQSELVQKLIIASAEEREYSRHFAEITFDADYVEVHNTSSQVILFGSDFLEPSQKSVAKIPTKVAFLNRTLHFKNIIQPKLDATIFSLPCAAEPPNLHQFVAPSISLAEAASEANIDSKRLLELLQAMLQIFQDSPNCPQFFDQAAVAMIQLLQLDHVLIAFHRAHLPDIGGAARSSDAFGNWCYQSFHQRTPATGSEWVPSSHILRMLETEKKTVYQVPDVRTQSLVDVTCLVASPLLNSNNELIGFIYGDRHVAGIQMTMFSDAEAKFVELFANGISIGLERLNQERKISEMRSRFDQFFTPELARQLESDPTLLEPRSAQVSVLFADIRGFSRISERIGPQKTIDWINSVMSHLSDCVFKHDGVVVDYIGDEILAMWGAPLDRNNHAELAVRGALEMQKRLPEINALWESTIGEPVEIGIGINSGEAQVGNIGSDRKFKYGPLGDVVNVSSRLEGATKQLGTRLLVTESTASSLPKEVLSRKIRTVRFVNVRRAVSVYEIPIEPDDNWVQLKTDYENGLDLYERGELREASQQMASVINRFPEDGPSVHLLSDSVSNLSRSPEDFDSVWKLTRK